MEEVEIPENGYEEGSSCDEDEDFEDENGSVIDEEGDEEDE